MGIDFRGLRRTHDRVGQVRVITIFDDNEYDDDELGNNFVGIHHTSSIPYKSPWTSYLSPQDNM